MTDALLPDALLARYRPQSVLGEGGFGRVVRAEDLQQGTAVAIKLLHKVDDEQAGRMQREAKMAASLDHPHALSLLDHGILADGTPYLVTPFIDGADLLALSTSRRLRADEVRTWTRQVGEALAAAHTAGIVHRDVKPENVMVTREGDAILCDFGLARSLHGSTFVTQEGLLLGTPEYMAPELWRGLPPSPGSDQWAWAAMVYLLQRGGRMYPDPNPGAILRQIKGGFTAPEGCPPALARALADAPEDRYPDMAAAIAAVGADSSEAPPRPTVATERSLTALSGEAPIPRPRPPAPNPQAPDRRPLALGLGLAALAGFGWFLRPAGGPPVPPPLPAPPSEEVEPASENRPPLERLRLTPELAGNLRRLEKIFGLLEGRDAYQDQRREKLIPALVTHRFQPIWLDTLGSLPEYFEDAERDPEVTLTVFAYLRALAQDLRSLGLLGDPLPGLQEGLKVDEFHANSHDEAVDAIGDESLEAYLSMGDLRSLPSDELALRASLSAKFRPTLAAHPPLEAEVLRRLDARGISDPWTLLAYGDLHSVSSVPVSDREERTRALLDELARAPGIPDVVEASAHLSLFSWLVCSRERTRGELAPPEDLARLAPVLERCRNRIPNGLPGAVEFVNELDTMLQNHAAAGLREPMGVAWWHVPELLPAHGLRMQPLPEWSDNVAIVHLKLIAPRLVAEEAVHHEAVPLLLDRALATLRDVRRAERHPYSLGMLETTIDAVHTLATQVPPGHPLEAPLRDFAKADLRGIDHRLRTLQRRIPEALAFGKNSDLVDTTVDSFRDMLRDKGQPER